ncbi:MAG TPA: glycerol-3-phosphate dehydrogenase/oxidase [Gemmatimonadota bacterium]|nr:glycerol-3-phosphate dehydrogenase/oxidase [Gemmatimonadota bacterium]
MRPGPAAAWDRAGARETLERKAWDVVVIGGGVTGAGVARDAVLRGLSVALVEAGDWGSGASSRTTKFAHGGLRYLEHLDLDLVRTALAERAVLLSIAPHLVRPVPFLIPAVRGSLPIWKVRAGLRIYDALAAGARLGRHRILDAGQARAHEPLLSADGLDGAGIYGDCLIRDARLVIETVADARRSGVVAASRLAVREVERWDGGWLGDVEDRRDGSRFTLRGAVWVNATGPWTDRLRRLAAPGVPPLLEPTKGIHVVLPWTSVPVRDPVALTAADGRLVFAVPEGGWTYVGTTDTRDAGDVDDLGIAGADVEYLLAVLGAALDVDPGPPAVAGAWAGWRPLVRSGDRDPDAIPRDEAIEETAPGFLTVAGGKLTTYRRMAEDTVDRVQELLGRAAGRCVTSVRPLVPSTPEGAGPPRGTPPETVARVRELFGPDAGSIFAQWLADPASAEPLAEGFPWSAAEVRRASLEMVESLEDLIDRRLSALPGGEPIGDEALVRAARVAAEAVGWDERREKREVGRFRDSPAGDPLERRA